MSDLLQLGPGWLLLIGCGLMAHGLWDWLNSDHRAAENKRLTETYDMIYEDFDRPADAGKVEFWAFAEIAAGAAFALFGGYQYLISQGA